MFVIIVVLSQAVVGEFKRIIEESEVSKENDENWPAPDKSGRQELEFRLGREHISFNVSVQYSLSLHFQFVHSWLDI